jgi:hypothetical protein
MVDPIAQDSHPLPQASDSNDVDDIEIVAYIVRLCRAAAPMTRGHDILLQAGEAYPQIDGARLKSCAAIAAEKLMRQGDYRR